MTMIFSSYIGFYIFGSVYSFRVFRVQGKPFTLQILEAHKQYKPYRPYKHYPKPRVCDGFDKGIGFGHLKFENPKT